MDESVKAIQDRGQIHSEKCQGCKSEKLYLRYRQMRVHRDLDSRTRFDLKFFRVLSKNSHPELLHYSFLHQKRSHCYLYWRRLSPDLPIAK